MKIITEKFVFGGKSLGKIDGKNVFLPFAIPGEELEINITESKKDYDNGQIVKIHRIFSTVYFYMYIIKF